MGLCVLYYVVYSLCNVERVGFFLSGLELHFKSLFPGISIYTVCVILATLNLYQPFPPYTHFITLKKKSCRKT